MTLFTLLAPELVLIGLACVLFFLGTATKAGTRRAAAFVAFFTLAAVFVWQLTDFLADPSDLGLVDDMGGMVRGGAFATFVNALVAGVGATLMLLAWPSDPDGTGGPGINFGSEAGEFFALALLALAGVMLVGSANDIVLLFLAIELAAIPTYIMVSISRPLPVAQEAGVKYFFLGAMAAAVMLFGFSYLYGVTGQTRLDLIAAAVVNGGPAAGSAWLLLGTLVLLAGFAFKIAAVPLHAYAGDVYQGAATPVTALLAFVPKTSGFVAIIKLMSVIGGPQFAVPELVVKVLWALSALTMTFGNVLGLLQLNIKRVFAYSSIAHSGYMLAAVTALASAHANSGSEAPAVQAAAIQGVLFYLAAYGMMNTGAFGILLLLPARPDRSLDGSEAVAPATTAETFEDLAGQGRRHPILGLAMALCCFSLIGLPVTVGFLGKYMLVSPALQAKLNGLVVILVLNSAVSAAYYLKIVATLFVRPLPADEEAAAAEPGRAAPRLAASLPLVAGVAIAVIGTLFFGVALPATDALGTRIGSAGLTVSGPLPTPAAPAVV
ncbi:MAG TPA: NADH-quinone oxidoreductase subunit N, partial [Humisphaera sp.]